MEIKDGSPKQLYTSETVYRPIVEEDSLLLEVQTGCSYGRCAFCDFTRDKYGLIDLSAIKENAKTLGEMYPEKETLFLLGQNTLSIKTERLLEILSYIKEYMPNVAEISLYGRCDDINRKGFSDMSKLASAGLTTVHVGVESGSDRVLSFMKKGVSYIDMRDSFKILSGLDIGYHITYILGLGGRALWREHVAGTVKLFNEINPLSIWALNLVIWPETELASLVENGSFAPLLPEEALFEEKMILEQARLNDCFYMDTTVLGEYSIMGLLPGSKGQMLDAINNFLSGYDLEEFISR